MDKKIVISRLIKITAILLSALLFVGVTQNRVDSNSIRIKGFYLENDNTLDVVLVGASEIYTGYSPALAYDEFGYTSYSYAIESNFIDLFKSQMIEIHKTQSPKLVVVELNGATYNQSFETNDKQLDATMRKYTDSIPLSKNKINTINTYGSKDEKLSYYCPFIMYHGSMSNFKQTINNFALQSRGYSCLKGINICSQNDNYQGNYISVKNDLSVEPMSPEAEEKLRDFLGFCKEQDYNVIFVKFPHRITTDKQYLRYHIGNYMEKIVLDYGYDFLNFEREAENIGLNFSEDFYDDDHLNIYGQIKFTKYFGEMLKDKYNISPSVLSETDTERWVTSAAYTKLFYEYFETNVSNDEELWFYETKDLIDELDKYAKEKSGN